MWVRIHICAHYVFQFFVQLNSSVVNVQLRLIEFVRYHSDNDIVARTMNSKKILVLVMLYNNIKTTNYIAYVSKKHGKFPLKFHVSKHIYNVVWFVILLIACFWRDYFQSVIENDHTYMFCLLSSNIVDGHVFLCCVNVNRCCFYHSF